MLDTSAIVSSSLPRPASGPPLRLAALPGVYAPTDDSWLLAAALAEEELRGARVLDLCTGSGVLALTAALAGADVTAVDVSRRAALTARLNLRRHRVPGRVLRGDLLDAVTGAFDVIVSNPPYVPATRADVPRRGEARAWDAGTDGRVVIDRICRAAPGRLRPGGVVLLVHSHVAGIERTVDLLRAGGLDAEVTVRRSLAFGPVMRERAAYLRSLGLVAPEDEHEELAVVRAVRPAGSAPASRAGGGRVSSGSGVTAAGSGDAATEDGEIGMAGSVRTP
ncbi:HemK2/MTQ2 family protein methyltransferase [Patulibacter sp. NPDC049589]|uniref:HemK2/MTQ2 family protein methyltransferase n=1 Tax=Patulibacter sp. NPDC049589 TaxID=3154731 RepID=UPI00341857E0